MKKLHFLSTFALAALLAVGCADKPAQKILLPVVPQPQEAFAAEGPAFNILGAAILLPEGIDARTENAYTEFAALLSSATGSENPILPFEPALEKGSIVLRYEARLPEEAYTIQSGASLVIGAASFPGFFYALQTLKQLLPVEALTGDPAPEETCWEIPAMKISDQPRFAYRGVHLDCARHFFSLDEVKKYIDVIALFKCNRFHWHLTEDQGWRIEIKKYPRLTEIGAWRDGTCIGRDFESSDGIRYGGYYTQDELREIVAYAEARNIIVIPELDLPGHMLAALASYPELGCTGGPYKVWQRWGITNDILCAGNEKVYTFIEDVLSEMIDIFPSEYIHIGGDECFLSELDDPWDKCPKCIAKMEELGIERGPEEKHYLQNYVTARVQDFLASKGRKVIGWDEILEGELAPGATVMSWRGTEGGIQAAAAGFDAIMSPYTYLYFDYYQSLERDKEPLCIGGHLPLDAVYAYEPLDGIPEGAEEHILGVQANLWTEYITTPEFLEYMLLPRLCALSEIQWCQPELKDYDRFHETLADHTLAMLESLGYTCCRDAFGEIGMSRVPARTEEELAEYLENETNRGW